MMIENFTSCSLTAISLVSLVPHNATSENQNGTTLGPEVTG